MANETHEVSLYSPRGQLIAVVVARKDRRFVARLDARLAEAVKRAGSYLTCQVGCVECCIGPFDITPLDALRLQRGLGQLGRTHPERAVAVVERARRQWELLRLDFGGDATTGGLSEDPGARLTFFSAHQALPCPALDPTGACELYEYRPISCRTFGLPIRCGDEVLPPCHLNFVSASADEIAAAAVDPDPEDLEGRLLAHLSGRGDTVVAWVLATTRLWDDAQRRGVRPSGSPR